MSDFKNLYRHSYHYLLGQIGIFVVGFISFPVFTRVFTVEEYGILSLVLSTVGIIVVVAKLGLQHSVQRYFPEYANSKDPSDRRRYYSTMLWSSAAVALVITLLYFLGVWSFPDRWVSSPLKKLLMMTAVLVFIRSVSSIVMNLWRAEAKTKAYSFVSVAIRGGTVAGIIVLLFTWERTLRAFVVGTIAVELLIMSLVLWRLHGKRLFAFKMPQTDVFKVAIAFGLPMVGYEISCLILDQGDRYLVSYFLGTKSLGYYSAAYNVCTYIQQAIAVPLNLAMIPIYMNLWVTKGKEETRSFLSRSLNHYLLVAIGLVAGVMVTGRDALVFLSSKKFEEAYHLLPTLVAGLLVYSLGIYLNAGLLIHKKTYTMMKLVFSSFLLNMAINVVLIPRIGLQGAAIATLISYVVLVAMMGWHSHALIPLSFDWAACSKYVAAATVAAFAAWNVNLQVPLANLAVKGSIFVALYFGILFLTYRQFRHLARKGFEVFFDRTTEPAASLKPARPVKPWVQEIKVVESSER
jgi:O-antigen/teichoic acid export membrane protein